MIWLEYDLRSEVEIKKIEQNIYFTIYDTLYRYDHSDSFSGSMKYISMDKVTNQRFISSYSGESKLGNRSKEVFPYLHQNWEV